LKVIAILENTISIGGGFSQSLNAIIQMDNISKGEFEFTVLSTNIDNLKVLEELNINCFHLRLKFLDKLFSWFLLTAIGSKVISKFKLITPFEKKIIAKDCNLIYFLSPSSTMSLFQSLNFIATVWDSSHRDSPEFDEVRCYGEFRNREHIYRNYLTQAFITIVDAEVSRESLHNRYGIDKDKMIIMPFSANPLLKKSNNKEVLNKYNLSAGYLFYPAQFWSHKNHIRILQALNFLKEKNQAVKVVFSGGLQENTNDYFNKIIQYIKDFELEKDVSIVGFVPTEDMSALYSESLGVIFPSYLGPTNIPPIEAWAHQKPLICSELHKEQVGKAAILFDPDNYIDISECILKLHDVSIIDKLNTEAEKQIKLINKKRFNSEQVLKKQLNSYKLRLD
jgi:glycosyltransferase involved in cell wall biosynthesis